MLKRCCLFLCGLYCVIILPNVEINYNAYCLRKVKDLSAVRQRMSLSDFILRLIIRTLNLFKLL